MNFKRYSIDTDPPGAREPDYDAAICGCLDPASAGDENSEKRRAEMETERLADEDEEIERENREFVEALGPDGVQRVRELLDEMMTQQRANYI
jgi:hypothetical protein